MKPQDLIFFIILAILIYKRDSKLFTIAGIISLILSIPLFSLWIFFTAQRLTWYAAVFFLAAIIINIFKLRKSND
ncbi:MAG: hypothetical protein Q7K55_07505 [Candidatus Levybacteria bacterium]|nr:hypothetical protein [Candidatus Levybacteria bacterium]